MRKKVDGLELVCMKDCKREHFKALMVTGTTAAQCVKRLDVALEFIFNDPFLSIHDKVAGDFDFEELIAALLMAHDLLKELDE